MQLHRLKFTKEEVKTFSEYYNAGHSIKEVSKYFNVGYRDILHYLIYFGYYIPKRKNGTKHNLCEQPRFFSVIDSEDKAYFLGLLMSDGYISTSLYNKEVGIALKKSDKYILEKINAYISPNKKLNETCNAYKWHVISSYMYNDLIKFGFTENKSHAEYIYPNIPKEYDSDFIRGYFDGDGCISIKSTGYNVISFYSNSLKFLQSLADKLLSYGVQTRPIYSSNLNRKSMFHTLYISGGVNKSIFKRLLYTNAKTFLLRKYERFKKIPC